MKIKKTYKSIGCLLFYHPFNAVETSVGLVIKSKYDTCVL